MRVCGRDGWIDKRSEGKKESERKTIEGEEGEKLENGTEGTKKKKKQNE